MKKVISLLLCLVMLTATLVSCGGGSTSKPEADRPNKTLRMAIIVDDKTTEEGVAAMQAAFNAACEVSLATRVEFECIKASEYRAKMDEILSGVASAGKDQSAAIEDAMANTDGGTVVEDEYAFPAASAGQFDIILIKDREMYEDYINKGWIKGLKSHLGGTFKVLNTKILPTVKAATYDATREDYFGVPANKAYGEYTYLVLNKKATDFYNLQDTPMTSLADAHKLIAAMETATDSADGLAKWEHMYGEDFSVIRESAEDYVMPNIQYLSQDMKTESLIGATYGFATTIARVENATNLLKNDEYVRYLTTKFQAENEGYFGDGTAKNFLVGIEKGDYALRFSDEENYTFWPIMYPVLNSDDVFGGMLAVSSFTVDEKRSLEIIQELMTDATGSNLLNLVLYGDAKNNYTLETIDEVSCVSFRNMSNYAVHKDYFFGGLREIAYPCLDYGQTAKTYAYVSQQITDLGTRTPLFDADFSSYFARVNADDWATVDALSKTKYEELMSSADLDAFLAKVDALVEELDANEVFSTLEQEDAANDTWKYETLGGAFYKYLRDRVDGKLGKPNFSSEDSETGDGAADGGATGDTPVA